jgi:hypothetical protein
MLVYLLRLYSNGLLVGRPRFDSRQGQEIFLYSTASSLALGPRRPPIQWVQEAVPPGIKQSLRAADHSVRLVRRSRMVVLCLHSQIRLYIVAVI